MIRALATALFLLVPAMGAGAQSSYKLVRHDEQYEALPHPRTGLDRVKRLDLADSRDDWFVTLGGEVRERFEVFRNAGWDPTHGADGFLLQRYMLLADLHLGRRVRAFVQLKSGLEHGRDGGPRPTDADRLDIHEAFVDVNLGARADTVLRLGRQEVALGSQRLVSVRAGPNVRQSFDGAAIVTTPGRWRLDVFALKPAETDPGVFDDAPDHTRTFWGLYAVGPFGLVPDGRVDLYYLGLDRKRARFDQGVASELRESIGTRVWGRAASWDYNFEAVFQWGRFASAPIRAWTFASDTGVTLATKPGRPRLGIKADVTSGDADPTHATLQTCNPLFPRGAYFGESQLVGPANHIDLHPSLDLRLTQSIAVHGSWLFLWRSSRGDGVYGVPGNVVVSGNQAAARYVGSQPTVMLTVAIGRHVNVGAAGEYFIAGPFLRESGRGRDVTYFGSWIGFVF